MDFSISEDLNSVQQLARQILEDHTTVERLAEVERENEGFDRPLWQALAEAGLLGLAIDERHGGTGLGFFALTMLCEEVGRTVAPVPAVPTLASAAATVQRFASESLQQRWLPGIASGELLLSAALEEYHNDDPGSPETQAKDSPQGWRVSGTKPCVPLAHLAQRVLLSASSDQGVLALLVDPRGAGVTLTQQVVTSGETRYEMTLEDVIVDKEDVVASGEAAITAARWARGRQPNRIVCHRRGPV